MTKYSIRAFGTVLLLVGIGAGIAAYSGMFYLTGSQYYEGCWARRAKENQHRGIESFFYKAEADNPSQAALWARCTTIMAESMDNAGFGVGSSRPEAPADFKALASVCPDEYNEMPTGRDRWYIVVIDAIEKTGGPSLIDRVAPATWLVERVAKARWPRCIDAANKVRKDMSPVTQR